MRIVVFAAGLLAVAVLFAVLSRFWPAVRGQRTWRRPGMWTDLTYLAFAPTAGQLVTGVTVAVSVLTLAAVLQVSLAADDLRAPVLRDTWVSRQPLLFQVLSFLVLADFLSYWQHRVFHRAPRLWRIHAVHHSSTQVDWLSSVRVHPLNDVVANVVTATPLLLLGYSPAAFAAYVPLFTLYALMLHANLSWSYGPLRTVLASPTFHRWHHSCEAAAIDKNFAGLLPLWDRLFGTLYMPEGQRPHEFGVTGESVPPGFHRQLVYPFRRRGPRPPTPAAAPR
jgi:sterol desaturase/sphingolipid hydroxylase (fatty acid hydroxylase superfamily)